MHSPPFSRQADRSEGAAAAGQIIRLNCAPHALALRPRSRINMRLGGHLKSCEGNHGSLLSFELGLQEYPEASMRTDHCQFVEGFNRKIAPMSARELLFRVSAARRIRCLPPGCIIVTAVMPHAH